MKKQGFLAVCVIRRRFLGLLSRPPRARPPLSVDLSPSLSVSFARHCQSLLARGLLSNHRRFKRLHERNGANRCCFTVHIDEIAQMKKTRDAVPVLLSRLGEIDIDPFVWLKKRRHLSPCGARGRGALAKYLPTRKRLNPQR
jgi:hypothetical protein